MTVAFIGHRNVERTEILEKRLTEIVVNLIEKEKVDTFLFGSRSRFDSLCYEIVSKLKKTYTNINRVYVRATYEYIDEDYADYLLKFYEKTFFPDKVSGAGAKSYVVRNQVMVDMCDVLVTYCDSNYTPPENTTGNKMLNIINASKKKSGTQTAIRYAQKMDKRIINLISEAHV